MTDRTPVVAVIPERGLAVHRRLFEGLAAAFGVDFAPWSQSGARPDAVILTDGATACSAQDATLRGLPVLVTGSAAMPASATEEVRIGEHAARRTRRPSAGRERATEEVRIGEHAAIDRRLRGAILDGQPAAPALTPVAGEVVLAAGAAGPAWTTMSDGACRVDRVRGALPVLSDADVLRDGLRGSGSLALLALVQLLRTITPAWTAPPLRATFVFDDPNLRRPTYGHLDYRGLLAHADDHGYHAAMAMVPLDVRRPSADAVATFRGRPDRLSLAIHGNDHVRDELMQPRSESGAVALGAHALRRIARFEQATGVCVDRVMIPPHGLCSARVVRALGKLGYEAICAIHPAPWTERPPPDRLLAGWSPAELVDGSAIIPRFPLTVCATEIALRAFLDQPLVLYGHHGDLAGGLEPLAEAVARVNRLGDVRWCSCREIARASHAGLVRDGVLRVRPWARVLRVAVPDGIRAMEVAAPPGGLLAGYRGWLLEGDPRRAPAPFGAAVPVPGGAVCTLSLVPNVQIDARSVASPRSRVWPLARRRATEARDRLAPRWRTAS